MCQRFRRNWVKNVLLKLKIYNKRSLFHFKQKSQYCYSGFVWGKESGTGLPPERSGFDPGLWTENFIWPLPCCKQVKPPGFRPTSISLSGRLNEGLKTKDLNVKSFFTLLPLTLIFFTVFQVYDTWHMPLVVVWRFLFNFSNLRQSYTTKSLIFCFHRVVLCK